MCMDLTSIKNKKGEKVLLVQCMNALYGTMVASLLFYKKFVTSLKKQGFELNPYDPCVANKTVDGKVLTVCFHLDDNKISHKSSKVVDCNHQVAPGGVQSDLL